MRGYACRVSTETIAPLPEFFCPLCGSNKCVYVIYRSPGGKMTRMSWYRCAGCTVMFEDAHRFSAMMRYICVERPDGQSPRVEEVRAIGKRKLQDWEMARLGPDVQNSKT